MFENKIDYNLLKLNTELSVFKYQLIIQKYLIDNILGRLEFDINRYYRY